MNGLFKLEKYLLCIGLWLGLSYGFSPVALGATFWCIEGIKGIPNTKQIKQCENIIKKGNISQASSLKMRCSHRTNSGMSVDIGKKTFSLEKGECLFVLNVNNLREKNNCIILVAEKSIKFFLFNKESLDDNDHDYEEQKEHTCTAKELSGKEAFTSKGIQFSEENDMVTLYVGNKPQKVFSFNKERIKIKNIMSKKDITYESNEEDNAYYVEDIDRDPDYSYSFKESSEPKKTQDKKETLSFLSCVSASVTFVLTAVFFYFFLMK